MAQMNVDDLVKLLDSFSQKGGASIKPQFDGEKANFVVGFGDFCFKRSCRLCELCEYSKYESQ